MNDWNIMEKLPTMLTGQELKDALKGDIEHSSEVRNAPIGERLIWLNNIYNFYYPNKMGEEIYTKMYLSMVRSLQKKESRLAIEQRSKNALALKGINMSGGFGGISGQDVFSIIGPSGIGKSTAIGKAVDLIKGNDVIELENPYCKIIPTLSVQCPYDCSAKTLLYDINRKIDAILGTNYYDMQIKARASTNHMIISTAQILLNHVAGLILDEVQNLIKHKAGNQLIGLLTEMLNESGISVIMVGTPEVEPFFNSVDYLARRTTGLKYDRYKYDDNFANFCKELWQYQYTKEYVELSEVFINYLYQHSSGTLAHVVYLFATAQEIAILNGIERITLSNLDEAYERMHTLHTHIQPELDLKKRSPKRKREKSSTDIISTEIADTSNITLAGDMEDIIQDTVDTADSSFSFIEAGKEARSKKKDMIELIQGKVSVTELAI